MNKKLLNNEIKKILIIRLSALGDCIHTLPLAAALRKKYPCAQIDWIVEDKAAKFIINNPLLTKVYVLEKTKWKQEGVLRGLKEFYKIIEKMRKEKYDIIIDTQQLFKSALIECLLPCKRKITLDGGREFSFLAANEIIKTNRKLFDINYHVVKRNLEIAAYLDCEDLEPVFILPDFSNEYSENIVNIINNLDKSRKTIVISPATTWENKHWSIQGWVDVINEFKNEYNIIISASMQEKNYISEITSHISGGNIIDLSGMTTAADLVYIYKNADLLVSVDSGSAQSAWAAQCKSIITLFFATSPARTAPFGDKYFSIRSNLPCAPCMKKQCRRKNAFCRCRENITSENVINFIKKVLQKM